MEIPVEYDLQALPHFRESHTRSFFKACLLGAKQRAGDTHPADVMMPAEPVTPLVLTIKPVMTILEEKTVYEAGKGTEIAPPVSSEGGPIR
jgi:hypothetical protein